MIFAHWCVTWHSHFPLSRELETWLGKPTPKQTFFRKMIFIMHYFWMRSKLMKAIQFLRPLIIYTSPLSAAKKYSSGKLQNEALSLAAFRVVYVVFWCVHWELWFHGFNAVFFLKNVFRNCKMSKMHVNHSRVVVDLENTLQCGSAESKTAKNQTSWRHREWILRWAQSEYLNIFTRG